MQTWAAGRSGSRCAPAAPHIPTAASRKLQARGKGPPRLTGGPSRKAFSGTAHRRRPLETAPPGLDPRSTTKNPSGGAAKARSHLCLTRVGPNAKPPTGLFHAGGPDRARGRAQPLRLRQRRSGELLGSVRIVPAVWVRRRSTKRRARTADVREPYSKGQRRAASDGCGSNRSWHRCHGGQYGEHGHVLDAAEPFQEPRGLG